MNIWWLRWGVTNTDSGLRGGTNKDRPRVKSWMDKFWMTLSGPNASISLPQLATSSPPIPQSSWARIHGELLLRPLQRLLWQSTSTIQCASTASSSSHPSSWDSLRALELDVELASACRLFAFSDLGRPLGTCNLKVLMAWAHVFSDRGLWDLLSPFFLLLQVVFDLYACFLMKLYAGLNFWWDALHQHEHACCCLMVRISPHLVYDWLCFSYAALSLESQHACLFRSFDL